MSKRLPIINYTSRDFASIRRDLDEYNKRYYPNISKDENKSSFDSMIKDNVAYIGDILSFYQDYNFNESFFDTSIEYNNIIKHAKAHGFKFRGNPSSFGEVQLYLIVEANPNGLGPNQEYLLTLEKGSEFGSTSGNGFILNEDVDFSEPRNPVVVARTNEENNIPTAYAIKAKGKVISGKIIEEFIDVGPFEKFKKIELAGRDISEILSIVDAEGNEYFEVDYLSQDIIFTFIPNDNEDRFLAPFILRPVVVPRRFIVERERSKTFIQFGAGSEDDLSIEPIFDPSTVVLNIFGKNYVSDISFDPTNLLGSDKMGISPSNTRLRITYRTNTTNNVNASANSITEVVNPIVRFRNVNTLDLQKIRATVDSLEVNNEQSIVGDITIPTVAELKHRVYGTFPTQNRAVSSEDYKSVLYNMPAKLGAIKRVNVFQDPDSQKRNINIYVVSENSDGTLIQTNATLKQNIRQWLVYNKMMNDSIDILDAKIINIQVETTCVADLDSDKFEVKTNVDTALSKKFSIHQNIGERFYVSDIYKTLQKVDGVIDVLKAKVKTITGVGYSSVSFDIDEATSGDGRFINVPQNVILEVKYLSTDIKGVIV